jgi:hypothetical protein
MEGEQKATVDIHEEAHEARLSITDMPLAEVRAPA